MARVSIRSSWNQIAESYQRENLISTQDVHYGALCPGESELNLVGEVRGKSALELGCGGGQNCIALSKRGALAHGVDISDRQLSYARALAKREGARVWFHRASMDDLGLFPDGSFDLVISAFSVAYVANIDRTFAEVARVLKSDGVFVLSEAHPISSAGRAMRRRGQPLWLLEDYFGRRKQFWKWPRFKDGTTARFYSYHRTIQDYIQPICAAGLVIERLLEPEPLNPRTKARRRIPCLAHAVACYYEVWKRFPYTLIIKARKPAR